MSTSHVRGRALAASIIGFGIALAGAPTALADPVPPPGPVPGPEVPPPAPVLQADAPAPGLPAATPPGLPAPDPPADSGAAAATACKAFGSATNYAASGYEDFVYNIAGNGPNVDYGNPLVQQDNVYGRAALQNAAVVAFQASTVPGLQPEIASPMQQWSLQAARLTLTMGIGGNGDMLDGAATDMNKTARDAQMACAQAGTHA